jgi:hypothetical protein
MTHHHRGRRQQNARAEKIPRSERSYFCRALSIRRVVVFDGINSVLLLPTVVIPRCHNIQHDLLTDSRQRAPDSHQYALTIRSHLHSRRSSDHLRGLPNAFLHSHSIEWKKWKSWKMSTKVPRSFLLLQNTVCLVHLKQSTGLLARLRREYIGGSIGNHKWRSSTFLEATISACRCWNRAL